MIEVNHLTKQYGDHIAVDDLSFTIEKGHIYGFLGPNGAGKSTTMNIMTGCLSATKGDVKIGGYDIFSQPLEAKKLIGYLPEIPPVYIDNTPEEYLRFVAEAKGMAKAEIPAEVERVMAVTQITHMRRRLIKHLSKGYRQRVGIAEAMVGDPEVIILDEPTVGLDPMQIIEIRELIKTLGENHTVILSSHILSEVQAVCEKVIIINHGKMIAYDTPANLESLFASATRISLTVDGSAENAKALLAGIEGIDRIEVGREYEGKTELVVVAKLSEDDSLCRSIFNAFADAKTAILKLAAESATLEDIFINLTGENVAVQTQEAM